MKINKTTKKIGLIFLLVLVSIPFYYFIAIRAIGESYETLVNFLYISLFLSGLFLLISLIFLFSLNFYIYSTKYWNKIYRNRTFKLKNLLKFYFGKQDFNDTKIKKYKESFHNFLIITIFFLIGVFVFMIMIKLIEQGKEFNILSPFNIVILLIIICVLCWEKLKRWLR